MCGRVDALTLFRSNNNKEKRKNNKEKPLYHTEQKTAVSVNDTKAFSFVRGTFAHVPYRESSEWHLRQRRHARLAGQQDGSVGVLLLPEKNNNLECNYFQQLNSAITPKKQATKLYCHCEEG